MSDYNFIDGSILKTLLGKLKTYITTTVDAKPSVEKVAEMISRNSAAIIGANQEMSTGFTLQSAAFQAILDPGRITCLETGPWYKISDGVPVQCGSESGVYVGENDVATVMMDETLFYFLDSLNHKYQRVKLGDPTKPFGALMLPSGEQIYIQSDATQTSLPTYIYAIADTTTAPKFIAMSENPGVESTLFLGYINKIPSKVDAIEFYVNCTIEEALEEDPIATSDLNFPTSQYYCTAAQTADSVPIWTLNSSFFDTNFTSEQFMTLNSGVTSELVDKLKNVETGAQVNVQSDWTQTNSNSDDFIKNKPNITQVNSAINITAPNVGYSAGVVNISTESGRGVAGEINLKTAENSGNGTININAQAAGVVNMTANTTNVESQYVNIESKHVNIGTDVDGLLIQRVGDNTVSIETSPDQSKLMGSELYITAKQTGDTRGKLCLTAEGDGEIKLQGKSISAEYGLNNSKASVRTYIMPGCYNIISSSEFSRISGNFQLQTPNDYASTDDDRYVFEYNGEFTTPTTGSSLSFNVDGCTMLGEYGNLDTNTKYQFSILNNICIVIKVG